jgi:hypothetical protein
MAGMLRLGWEATRGHRLRPWRSPYLRWRIETYSGLEAEHIGARQFFAFLWRHAGALARYARWRREMAGARRHSLHPAQSGAAGPQE